MAAFRDSITAQMQQLQHSMAHLNLLQMPNLPNLPNYQAYLPTTAPMVRRISNLVPHIGSPKAANATVRPQTPASPTPSATAPPAPKEADSKWWDLFSSSSPPAYEDIYPHPDEAMDTKETKISSAQQAAADTLADNACAELFDKAADNMAGPSSAAELPASKLLSLNASQELTEEEQVQLQLANTTKVRFRSDRKLFFIWVSDICSPMIASSS